MLKQILKKVLAVVFVFTVVFVGASQTEAAKLQEQRVARTAKATIVVENISNDEYVQVLDLSGIKKMSGAIKWIEDNAQGKNLRFVSTDPEMLDSWKNATIEAGFKVDNPEENYKKVSTKAKRALKRGNTYSFEIKTIKRQGNNDLEKGISYVMSAAGLWAAFK